jgi:hypothetical protein
MGTSLFGKNTIELRLQKELSARGQLQTLSKPSDERALSRLRCGLWSPRSDSVARRCTLPLRSTVGVMKKRSLGLGYAA